MLLDADLGRKYPLVPMCTGHLQRLMATIMRGVCDDAGIELLVDDAGVAYLDPEISREWETQSEANC